MSNTVQCPWPPADVFRAPATFQDNNTPTGDPWVVHRKNDSQRKEWTFYSYVTYTTEHRWTGTTRQEQKLHRSILAHLYKSSGLPGVSCLPQAQPNDEILLAHYRNVFAPLEETINMNQRFGRLLGKIEGYDSRFHNVYKKSKQSAKSANADPVQGAGPSSHPRSTGIPFKQPGANPSIPRTPVPNPSMSGPAYRQGDFITSKNYAIVYPHPDAASRSDVVRLAMVLQACDAKWQSSLFDLFQDQKRSINRPVLCSQTLGHKTPLILSVNDEPIGPKVTGAHAPGYTKPSDEVRSWALLLACKWGPSRAVSPSYVSATRTQGGEFSTLSLKVDKADLDRAKTLLNLPTQQLRSILTRTMAEVKSAMQGLVFEVEEVPATSSAFGALPMIYLKNVHLRDPRASFPANDTSGQNPRQPASDPSPRHTTGQRHPSAASTPSGQKHRLSTSPDRTDPQRHRPNTGHRRPEGALYPGGSYQETLKLISQNIEFQNALVHESEAPDNFLHNCMAKVRQGACISSENYLAVLVWPYDGTVFGANDLIDVLRLQAVDERWRPHILSAFLPTGGSQTSTDKIIGSSTLIPCLRVQIKHRSSSTANTNPVPRDLTRLGFNLGGLQLPRAMGFDQQRYSTYLLACCCVKEAKNTVRRLEPIPSEPRTHRMSFTIEVKKNSDLTSLSTRIEKSDYSKLDSDSAKIETLCALMQEELSASTGSETFEIAEWQLPNWPKPVAFVKKRIPRASQQPNARRF